MTRQVIKGNLVLPEKVVEAGLLVIEDGRIMEILEASQATKLFGSSEITDYSGFWVMPGLIDVHLHGARGKEAMDGKVESIREMARHQASCGVTGFSRPP